MAEIYNSNAWTQNQSVSIAADTNGTTIDLQGYNGCFFAVHVGASGSVDASNFLELSIQHADESGVTDTADTFAACADADLTNTVTGTLATTGCFAKINDAAEDDATYFTEYIGRKRFVRVRFDEDGTFGAADCVVIIAKTTPVYGPAN